MSPFVPFIGVAALALPAPGARAVYGGSTRAGDAIVVNANRSATKARSVVIAWEAECGSGMTITHSDVLRAAPFSPLGAGRPVLGMTRNRNGRFAGKQLDAGTLDGGESVGVTVTMRGKLSRARASGTLAVSVVVRDPSGAALDACRATTSWRASRAAGRIYGGSTSQREPLVIRLNRARTTATDVMLDWQSATCTPDDFVSFGEHFRLFPVSASGVFGASFRQSYPTDGGGQDDYAYQLRGKIGRLRAHGTFRATATSKDDSGAMMESCDSAPLTWSATTG